MEHILKYHFDFVYTLAKDVLYNYEYGNQVRLNGIRLLWSRQNILKINFTFSRRLLLLTTFDL